jgi:hypothetical protein
VTAPKHAHKPFRGGKPPYRATKHWHDTLHGFVHTPPSDDLVTTNRPPNPNRNQFSLGSSLRRNPSSGLDDVVEDYAVDGQLSFERLRNYSATVYAISQDRVSHDAFALIEHL